MLIGQTFICQSQRDYDTLARLNKTRYEPRTLSNGKHINGGIVRLNLVNLTPDESNVNPRPMCSANEVSLRYTHHDLA